MTKAGERILASARKALLYAQGQDMPGFRVHIPDVIDAARIRAKQGLSQSEFAAKYGFPLATLQDWEQARRIPDRSAQILLIAIDHEPEIIHQAAVAGGFAKVTKRAAKAAGAVRDSHATARKAASKDATRKIAKRGRKRVEA